MTNSIYKYELPDVIFDFEIKIPDGAKFLTLQMQRGSPHMWFLVDLDRPKVNKRFWIRATGETFDYCNEIYLGTFQVESILGRLLVWHVFEANYS